MQLPAKALTFDVDSATNIAFVARGSGLGITFELWRRNAVDPTVYDFLQLVGPTYPDEQSCNTAITAAGGEVAFITQTLVAALNALLKMIWPGSGSVQPPANVLDRINGALADSFVIFKDSTGLVQIKAK